MTDALADVPQVATVRMGESDPLRDGLGPLGRMLPSTHHRIDARLALQMVRRLSVTRSLYYSLRFRGRFLVARGTRVVLRRSSRVEFAPGAYLLLGMLHHGPNRTLLNMGRDARLVVRGTVQAWRGAQLTVLAGGCLDLGDKVIFNEDSRAVCLCSIRLGEASGLSWGSSVTDSDLHPIAVEGRWLEPLQPVEIGDHVMVAAGARILKGVRIGDGALVAAGAVVTGDVPARAVVAGNPARVVRHNVDWN